MTCFHSVSKKRRLRGVVTAGTLVLLLCNLAAPALAATLEVPADYATIQEAVDDAANGDVVLIAPGFYEERVVVNGKAITLASHFHTTGDRDFIDQTVIDGFGGQAGTAVVSIGANISGESNIIGLTLSDADDGVLARSRVNILDSRITGTTDAIDYEDDSGGIVRGCLIEQNSDDAVDFDDTSSGIVEQNQLIDNGDDGIEIRLPPNPDSSTVAYIIRNNIITGNDEDGIQIIAHNTPSNREVRIEGNLIADNRDAGLGLMCCTETSENFEGADMPDLVLVFNNTFRNNDHAITGGDNLVAVNNIFVDHNVGLKRLLVDSVAAHNLYFTNGTDFVNVVDDFANLFSDPLLTADDSLGNGSPAIDAGTDVFVHNGETLLNLAPSDYAGAAPDLGAFEAGASSTPSNQAPDVNAGQDRALTSSSTNLAGVVTDDGLPGSGLVVQWSQVSGPGTVTFGDTASPATTASFSSDGTYVLRLDADDGALSASDEISITVNTGGGGGGGDAVTVEVRVAASADDAEEQPSQGRVLLTSSDLELVLSDASPQEDQIVGMRFNSVSIPQGSVIVDAYVQFQVDETDSGTANLTIEGEAADNAPAFTSADGNVSSRARTAAAVTWSPAPWPTVGASGVEQRTPDIAAIIQQVVSRAGWSSGNSLAVIITGTGRRTAEAFDGDSAAAPLLHVEYASASGGNQAPTVSAGADQNVTLPSDATLDGTLDDDGLPTGTVATTWSQVSGPGTVTFADPNAVDTSASFSTDGTYVLRLSADDGELNASDEVTVTVAPASQNNQAPTVSAGADQNVTLPGDATLNGTVSDDGLPNPPGAVTTTWSQVSGPGTVTFADANAAATSASFSTDGTYVLRLSGDDGELGAADEMTVTVQAISSGNFDLSLSTSSNRSSPVQLDGAVVSRRDQIFVFVTPLQPEGDITRVEFFIDGSFEKTESAAPYDLAGTRNGGDAIGFDAGDLAVGSHTLRADIILDSGVVLPVSASFEAQGQSGGGGDDDDDDD